MRIQYDCADTHYVWYACLYTHTQTSSGARSQVERNPLSPRLTSSSIPLSAWLLMQSHKCHIASSGGTTNRNINMGKMREKSFFRSLSLFFPSANRLVPNPPGIRRDKLFLIGYIGINKHMSVANGSMLQKAIFIKSFRFMFSLQIVLSLR